MAIPSPEILRSLLSGESGPQPWIAPLIDHTFLKPEGTAEDISRLCAEAKLHHFGAVCVYPKFVALCVDQLAGSGVKVAAVAGFPTGTNPTAEKVREVQAAVSSGATEIDMVLNVPWLKRRKLAEVFRDIEAVVQAAGENVAVKVILETCLLDHDEKILGAGLAKAAGAAFLKTSTGFSNGGATETDVSLLRSVAGGEMGVKASGGVRNQADALRMILAGANRIGTSGGVAILLGKNPQSGVY